MAVICSKELDDKIVVFGMSCAGKTTFANNLNQHHYYCFDAMFNWHMIETMGLSIETNLKYISNQCSYQKYVIDGWSLADASAKLIPFESIVYVVYAPYDKIISQYRIEVDYLDQYRSMYKKWYLMPQYHLMPSIRYFRNQGDFMETSAQDFVDLVSRSIT